MKKMIRSLSLVLVFALLALLVPMLSGKGTNAFAADGFTVNSSGVLTGYTGAGGVVCLPGNVTELGSSVFSGRSDITEIRMNSGLKKIGDYAFYGCSGLKKVMIPWSVSSIGSGVFDNCTGLSFIDVEVMNENYCAEDGVLFSRNKAQLIRCPEGMSGNPYKVPDGVKIIGKGAFSRCFGILNISLPSGLTTIMDKAFEQLVELKSVTLPGSVAKIGSRAFYYNLSLKIVVIQSEPTVASDAFEKVSLTSVVYSGTNMTWFNSNFSGNYRKYSGRKDIVIDNCVLTGYSGTAAGCAVPEGIIGLAPNVFRDCTNLTGISLPSTLETIGQSAFNGCTGLTTIAIPSKVSSIGKWAFDNCTSLTAIIASQNAHYWSSNGVLYTYDEKTLVRYPQGKTNKSFAVPASVTTIGDSAFYKCRNLENVVLPNGLTKLEPYSFDQCSGLRSMTIPSSVKSIARYSFRNSYGMTRLFLMSVSPAIEDKNAFENSAVEDVFYAGSGTQWANARMGDVFGGKHIVYHYSPLKITSQPVSKTITLGESLTVSVGATGAGLQYQWYYKKTGQTSYNLWKGRTHASETCTPNDTWDGIQLYCEVTDAAGDRILSSTMTVTVIPPIVITRQPQNDEVNFGDPLTVSVEASGKGLKYQWYYRKKDQTTFSVWNGRTHASETCTPNATWDGIQLYCKITDSDGHTLNSDTVKITLYAPLILLGDPENQTVRLNESVTLSVEVDCYQPKYQWYYKKAGQTTFSQWNGRTHASETCTPNLSWDGIQLFCRITNGLGEKKDSRICTVHIMSITQQPRSRTVAKGSSVTLSVKATGGTLKYQWYYRKKGQTSFSVWSGRTHASETVTPNDSWDGIQLYCEVTGGNDKTIHSDTATVCFGTPMKITQQPTNQTVGAAGDQVKLSLKAEGTGLKYQWYYRKAGQNGFSQWNGHTRPTETAATNETWNGMKLYCEITDISGDKIKSDTITVSFK